MPSGSSSDSSKTASGRDRLPFEPTKGRKSQSSKESKEAKTPAPPPQKISKSPPSKARRESTTIPEVVSRRMLKRMAIFSGIPSTFGMSSFFVSYFLVTQSGFDLPTWAVVWVSLGFFGLGVLGLSYGVLSASWDEENPGSKLGWDEFTTNFGRMTEAWRSSDKS